jgi:hypothetical protein
MCLCRVVYSLKITLMQEEINKGNKHIFIQLHLSFRSLQLRMNQQKLLNL